MSAPAATPVSALAPAGDHDDWTRGGDGVVFQHCTVCGHRWTFRRSFCPGCGDAAPQMLRSAGLGQVHASTLVHRAPNDEFRAIAPYRIVLVDLAEGVRMMAHGEASLTIGDAVRLDVRRIAGRALPYCTKDPQQGTP